MLLENRHAIVYGGGGAIGGAIARAMAREGAHVHLLGRTEAKLQRVADDIAVAGGLAESAVVDALDEWALAAHADALAARVGSIDIAVNAVGIAHVQGVPFAQLTLQDFALPIERFLRCNFVTAKAVAPHMTRRGGVMLLLSTPGARIAGTGFLGYGVTCGAIETFTRLLAAELGADGIRVICLRPDAIPDALPMSYAAEVFRPAAARAETTVAAMLDEHARSSTLLRRLPTLAQVADYAAFVASDRCGAMTGAIANLSCGSIVD